MKRRVQEIEGQLRDKTHEGWSLLYQMLNLLTSTNRLSGVRANKVLPGVAASSEGSLHREDVIPNAVSLLLASTSSTAFLISCLLHNLATHQKVQQKLASEIDIAIGENGSILSDTKAIRALPYLSAVIKEGTRMYPSFG